MSKDQFAANIAAEGDSDGIRAILEDVCRITQMGFAAVARVTDTRWIAAQVLDKIEFGLNPGDELELKTTICDEIRQAGQTIVIDYVAGDPNWRTHHTPALYGFESYVSIPLFLDDGSFYGTLCAIDPHPRALSSPATVGALERMAKRVAAILSTASN
ncbi:GAF domain-containing protein [Sphingomonas sp. MMS24-J13]|uniref:GAF domain-containing protein n=1 Tax=Sphingomonas sp. MMS24-J13 TaxID=3238686 RepID=UPI00384D68F7